MPRNGQWILLVKGPNKLFLHNFFLGNVGALNKSTLKNSKPKITIFITNFHKNGSFQNIKFGFNLSMHDTSDLVGKYVLCIFLHK
jgi:hypothetical protein